jgi:hydrogenase maturation protease
MDVVHSIPPARCLDPAIRFRQVLVIGLGNTLLTDDGVGVHAVRRLAADPHVPSSLQTLDGGTLGFRLLDTITRSDAVLFIDAAELREPPGTIRLMSQGALGHHIRRGGRMSAHEAGLADLLTLAQLDGWAPRRLALLAIQPQRIDWADRLSESVARALPAACAVAIATVLEWRAAA